MTDLLLDLTESGSDLRLQGGDLVLDEGLQTTVIVSAFSDAQIAPDESLPGHREPTPQERGSILPPEVPDRRGWWAEPAFGSKLWLLDRAKLSDLTVAAAIEYVELALATLIEEGIAKRVEVTAERSGDRLEIGIAIHRDDAPRWAELWDATGSGELARVENAGVALRLVGP